MFVIKRTGEKETVHFDKITERIRKLCFNLNEEFVDPAMVSQKVINGLYSGITTSQLDELAAQTCAYMAAMHPDFSKLAARISVSNLHKNTITDFSEVCSVLLNYYDEQGRPAALISKDVHDFVQENKDKLNAAIDYNRDFEYDFFGFKTLERSYLLKVKGKIVERPQHMLMRVSVGIHVGDVDAAIETYNLMSQKYFTHATPTLFNAGTPRPQMSSCFLLTMKSDSIDGIFETLKQCAMISKYAGGIGLAVHSIRATDSYIRGTNGNSNGLVPMLRVFNDTARYVDQGGGKRKGSFAIYLEPWHADIMEWLDLKKNHGKEEQRARDLFYALWIPDLFMKRVEADGMWTLMCPNECPGLHEVWGEKFEELYTKYEKEGRGRKPIKAQALWFKILESQIETGTPFMLYKDACNRKSNQQNLGTIKSSNLCTEIIEYTAPDEIAVCNLASVGLPTFVDRETRKFDYHKLREVVKVMTKNLNKVIDRNFYPVEEAKVSNMRHRPIGLGVQGFADALMLMRLPYESEAASYVNKKVFETIYYAAVEASMESAMKEGPYSTWAGSPAQQGKLQFDLWGLPPLSKVPVPPSLKEVEGPQWDWDTLKAKVVTHGLRNSLLVAPMPTASTSQILGNNESFEPYTSNIYYRRVLSGEFFCVNQHLLNDLIARSLWSNDLKQLLIAHNGSVQNIDVIPADLKELYKTVWEIKQKAVIDMAADRGPYIDQSQSLNIYMQTATFAKLSSMHFYGWKKGLKTGVYYLRTQSAADPIKFTVDKSVVSAATAARSQASEREKEIKSSKASEVRRSPPSKAAAENADPNRAKGNAMVEEMKSLTLKVDSARPSLNQPMPEASPDASPVPSRDQSPRPVVCRWRRKGAPEDEHCDMCSG